MKILYSADSHGDLEALKIFRDYAISKNDLSVIVNSGDLIAPIFNGDGMQSLGTTSQILLQIRAQNQFNGSLEDTAKKLLDAEKCPKQIKEAARIYLNLNKRARDNINKQYESIKEIFDSFDLPVLTVPGNWDTKNIDDFIARENLHDKCSQEIDGVSFAGYGVSPESMIGVLPWDLELPFSGKRAYDFLVKQDPDVALVHCPPYGIGDTNDKGEKIGDCGILAYLLEESPSVVLAGHNHKPFIKEKGKTVIINSGNLGRYNAETGRHNSPEFGTFVEFELCNAKYFNKATLYKITDLKAGKDSIKPISEYEMSEKGLIIQPK